MNPTYNSGGLLRTLLIIEKILHKWQKLGTLVHGNLLLLNSVDGLIQYRRFPLFCPSLSELLSELQGFLLDNPEQLF